MYHMSLHHLHFSAFSASPLHATHIPLSCTVIVVLSVIYCSQLKPQVKGGCECHQMNVWMQGSAYEGRYSFSPFYTMPTLAYSAENMDYQGMDQLNTGLGRGSDAIWESLINHGMKSTKIIGMLTSAAVSYASSPHANCHQRNSLGKKGGDDDVYRLPTYVNSRIGQSVLTKQHGSDQLRPTSSCSSNLTLPRVSSLNSSQQEASATCSYFLNCQNAQRNSIGSPVLADLKLQTKGQHVSECANVKVLVKDHLEPSIHNLESRNGSYDDNGSYEQLHKSSHFTDTRKLNHHAFITECLTGTGDDFNRINQTIDLNATSEAFQPSDDDLCREDLHEPADLKRNERGKQADISRLQNQKNSKALLGIGCDTTNKTNNSSNGNTEEESVMSQPRQGSSIDDDSDSSMLDSVSVSKISSDDVLGALGKQHFWKARRAMLR
eukprot:Gb_05973 [translate_table: standard]